jgi:hypothetical protein
MSAAASVIPAILFFLFACSQTKAEPADHLVQLNCAGTDLQDQLTPQCWRKHDWGNHQISDSYRRPDRSVVQTFDFAPFGTAEFGSDGGQLLKVQPDGTVVIPETRDGGKPYEQYFVGLNCFNFGTFSYGTGWVVWKADVTSTPKETVALLAGSANPNACPALSRALTRYWSGAAAWFPFKFQQALTYLYLDLIVSEHYNGATIASSVNMERMFFSRRSYGLIAWEAWSKTRPDGSDIANRCPEVPWRHTPEADGYRLVDCRVWTDIVSDNFVPVNFTWP